MDANIALPAALIGDPARAAILSALADGRAQPASALAYAARISVQSASNHLAKLCEGGLLAVEAQGRFRYYHLSSPLVASALEALASLAPRIRSLEVPLSTKARSLRLGRSCYDHLAGRLGIAVTGGLEARQYLVVAADNAKHFIVTTEGERWFEALGIDVGAIKSNSRGLARRCLDWTERRHHLAGPLGAALFSRLLGTDWLRRSQETRGVTVTPAGVIGLRRTLDINITELDAGRPLKTSPL
jgi:DNA-binding transcriptional ArsR family regulator